MVGMFCSVRFVHNSQYCQLSGQNIQHRCKNNIIIMWSLYRGIQVNWGFKRTQLSTGDFMKKVLLSNLSIKSPLGFLFINFFIREHIKKNCNFSGRVREECNFSLSAPLLNDYLEQFLCYSWFHINGTCIVHSFNGDYLSIPLGTFSWNPW